MEGVEDVPQQQGRRLFDIFDLASRKAEEAALRRYEAAGWLRKMVGVDKGFPDQPSEEDFRLALRSGIVLCNVLNKVYPGAISKVVEAPPDTVIVPDGAALSVFQYFENVRNFLDAIEHMGVPAFEASDLEQGGKSSRIVNCILALKSYNDWVEGGGNGVWKFGGSSKPPSMGGRGVASVDGGKQIVRKNSGLFMNSISRNSSISASLGERSFSSLSSVDLDPQAQEIDEVADTDPLRVFIRDLISDKKQEDIPLILENMLCKLTEEFFHEHKVEIQNIQVRNIPREDIVLESDEPLPTNTPLEIDEPEDEDEEPENEDEEPEDEDEEPEADEALPTDTPFELETPQVIEEEDVLDADEPLPAPTPSEIEVQQKTSYITKDENYTSKRDPKREQLVEEQRKIQQRLVEQQRLIEKHHKVEQKRLAEQKRKVEQERLAEHQRMVEKQKLVERQQRRVQELKQTLQSAREDMQNLRKKYKEEVNSLGENLFTLATAANAYQKVLKENRKLYNQVQDLKGNIRVFCRVGPFSSGASSIGDIDESTITILIPSKTGKDGKKPFTFNKVFGSASTQEEVFEDTQPLIRSALDGYNVCIFAYGQTGAGKTHTMTGPRELTKDSLGVNYRALNDLLLISEQRKDTFSYEISAQMTEIYNEQIRDLLVTDGSNKIVEIHNKSQNGINLPDANRLPINSTSDVMNLMDLARKNRSDQSSRSHSCLTVHVHGKDLTSGTVLRGCMHLVDLAGSESAYDSNEKSLSALGDVLFALAQKQSNVPYRNSKLTQLLQESLGTQTKTLMFVHISTQPDDVVETLNTLRYAERLSPDDGKSKDVDVKDLKEQIVSLKAALASKDGEVVEDTERSKSRRQSLDNQQVSMNSPLWPISMEEDEVTSKSRRHSLDNGLARTQYVASIDDSDALSENSELDYQNPTSNSMPSGAKAKKPSTPKQKTAPGLRSQIPSSTAKRVANGARSPLNKTGKQPATADARRKPVGK